MAVKIKKWLPVTMMKFHGSMLVHSLEGFSLAADLRFTVVIKCQGVKRKPNSPFKRQPFKRNFKGELYIGEDGIWEWDKEFDKVCIQA